MTVKKTELIIHDQVNASFKGLDPKARRECNEALKFFIPYARHTPAFKLGRWDGKISYFALNGNTYVNLLDRVMQIVIDNGYEIELVDNREAVLFEFPDVDERYIIENAPNPVWPTKHPAAGQEILLRDYQVEVIRRFIENPQCIQEIATGAGKTLLTATLSHLVEEYGRSIIIVPNKSLVEQTESDYKNLGLDVGVYFGDRKEPGHQHTICTWQSLNILDQKTKEGKTATALDIDNFLTDVVCVMVDEVHQAKAEVLKNLLSGPFANVPIRWGLTGTVPTEDFEAIALSASIGPVVNHLAASELQDMGVLASCHVNILQLQDTVEFPTFHEEYEYLVNDRTRLDWMSMFIQSTSQTGNTLILVNRVTTGKELEKRIPNSLFVHGATAGVDRREAYDSVATSENMIIIATYGVAAVGINIPRIFNLILVEPGKSFVRVIQSIGRGIRKAEDKDHVEIYDIASRCKFSKRHITKRKEIYKKANYPHQVRKVDFIKELEAAQ